MKDNVINMENSKDKDRQPEVVVSEEPGQEMPKAPEIYIALTLVLDDCNLILEALAQGPYNRVAPVIGTIREQAIPQLRKAGVEVTE